MGLSYYYEFRADENEQPNELEQFLKEVEWFAQSVGFSPTIVLNVQFDTEERRKFSRRLSGSFTIQDERLKGVALPIENQIRDLDPVTGQGRLVPERGIVLVVTDERHCEACFGFLQFADRVSDIHGQVLAETSFGKQWVFRDFVDSPDTRYRQIVKRFAEAGYVTKERDEYIDKEN